MGPHTIEERVYFYISYVKYGSARRCLKTFHHKFPGVTVPSTTGIRKLTNKVKSPGSLLDKKSADKLCIPMEEKTDEVRARLEYTAHKSLRHLAQQTGIWKWPTAKATKATKLRPYKQLQSMPMYQFPQLGFSACS
jgi:hypothetical protein